MPKENFIVLEILNTNNKNVPKGFLKLLKKIKIIYKIIKKLKNFKKIIFFLIFRYFDS